MEMRWHQKYVKVFELGLQASMEYRVNFIMSIVSTIFPILIQVFLWTAIFNNSGKSIVYGYDYMRMLTYVIVAGIVSKLVATGVEWEISGDIKDGGLNKFIVRPVGYFPYRIASFLGQKVMQLGIVIILLTVVLTIINIKLGLAIEPIRAIIFLVTIILALILNLFITFIISTVAFWISEAWAAFMILNLVINVASGGIFPLDIFGDKVMTVLNFLPFKYIIYFPTNIINGKMSFNDIAVGILVQGVWIFLLSLISKTIWNIGMKKYVAIGG